MRRFDDKRQFVLNMASNLLLLAIAAVVMLWFTPYLIHRLGLSLYGLVPLALSLSTYLGLLTVGLQSALGRNLTLEVAGEDPSSASRVLTTAVGVYAVICAVVMPVLLSVAIYAPDLFDVPAGFETDAQWFFGLTMLSYVLSAFREIVGICAYATNRIDLQNLARLSEIVVRVGVVVVAFSMYGNDLKLVGLGMVAGSFVSLLVGIAAWRFSAADIRIVRRLFDFVQLRKMLATGGWVTLSHSGALLHMATDLIVINVVLGALIAGGYGSALQLSSFLRSLAGALGGALGPVLYALYARSKIEQLGVTSRRAVKLIGLGVGLPTALMIGLSRPIMGLWLGPEYIVLAPLVVAMVFHLPFNYAALPLDSIAMTFDRLKWPAFIAVATGVLNIVLSLMLAHTGQWALGVALATAISLTLKNGVFMPLYGAHLLGRPRRTFLVPMLSGLMLTGVIGSFVFVAERAMPVESWMGLIVWAVASGALYVGLAYAVLSAEDRQLLRSMIPGVRVS